jgi:hypothetical protein
LEIAIDTQFNAQSIGLAEFASTVTYDSIVSMLT